MNDLGIRLYQTEKSALAMARSALLLALAVSGCDDDGGHARSAAAAGSQELDASATDGGDDTAAVSGALGTRASLSAAVDGYLAALVARDPTRLALAPGLRFTENGALRTLGEGLWQTVGELMFQRKVLDPEQCGAVAQAVVTENGGPAVLGVRLKLEAGLISEIETIVAGRAQDEDPAAFVPLRTDVLLSNPQPEWETPVPEAERSTRAELDRIADLYFAGFGSAGTPAFQPVPFADSCHRWENGLQTTKDTGGCPTTYDMVMGSAAFEPTHRRYPVTDVENGISVGFVNFANLWVDFHMFKISGGKIQLIQAVLSSFASSDRSTGWEDREAR